MQLLRTKKIDPKHIFLSLGALILFLLFNVCMLVCVGAGERQRRRHAKRRTNILSVYVSAWVPRVTAACQGLGPLLQMVPASRSQGPQAPSHSLTRGRGSHGLGAHRLIAVAWPLGPLGPLGGSGVVQP